MAGGVVQKRVPDFRELADAMPQIVWAACPNGDLDYCNKRWYEFFGVPEDKGTPQWFSALHPDDFKRCVDCWGAAIKTGQPYEVEHRFKNYKTGEYKWYLGRAFAVRDEAGDVTRWFGTCTDIDNQKRTAEALRKAQKIDAVGQLAGGIAHDFNNLLTIINGRSQLMLGRLKPGDPMRRELELIYKTGERAAKLTRQLLAFSRQSVLAPKVFDLNSVITELQKILERLIREDIEYTSAPDPNLMPIKADPGQLEQVIINLVVNARDAMPLGGKLRIATSNVELGEDYARMHPYVKPGAYVMLSVSDSGCGMDSETSAHIFEPFFSTKEQGKGTGLGLSTVYGIVKQSGGSIEVHSELGKGTAFKIYLPATNEKLKKSSLNNLSGSPGKETVLLVEDEEDLRDMVQELLAGNGYTVLLAAQGVAALAVAEEHKGPIHLLLTDVVMPKMGGPELANTLLLSRPELKVIFMSGYTNQAVDNDTLKPDTNFLQKPFTPGSLVRKVREILDQTSPASPPEYSKP